MELDLSQYWAKPTKTIQEHNQDLEKAAKDLYELGYIKQDSLYELLKKACKYHDYGKVNKEFQKRVRAEGKKITFNSDKEVTHNILSLFFINPEDFENELEDYYRVAHAILNHHSYNNANEELREKRELIQQLLEEFPIYRMKPSTAKNLSRMIEDEVAIKVKGFLHKCDYSGSGEYKVEYPNQFLEDTLVQLLNRWKSKNDKAQWNQLQQFCIENRDENIIVTAQTGMGKTEAGLHWIGNEKGYFVLPIRTAINAIYDRVREELLENQLLDERLAILHSEALEYYAENTQDEVDNIYEYRNRGKQMSLPLNITTMDQIFDFIFKYNGYELKLATLSYSKIVIDEIQMYSPDLLAYLVVGLETIHKFGGKIAILTATLSPFIKDCFHQIPFKEAVFVDDLRRHHVEIKEKEIDTSDILTKYAENLACGIGNKILVVCNTISKAQQIYRELSEKMPKENGHHLHILHSRFIKKERSEKEQEILAFGQTFVEDKMIDIQSGIWISTSLVEASLDIDFDYLFTELQDLNSLFQRLGRCNRKGVKPVEYANCYVYSVIEERTLTTKTRGFIDRTLFELSKKALSGIQGILTEQEKVSLIQKHLTTENLKESDYYRSYKKNYESVKNIPPYHFQKDENTLRNILSETIIPSPVYEQYKCEIKDLEARFQKEMSVESKVIIRQELMKYTLSIPYYTLVNYRRSAKYRESDIYVILSKQERVLVMECDYGELGFQEISFKERILPANVL